MLFAYENNKYIFILINKNGMILIYIKKGWLSMNDLKTKALELHLGGKIEISSKIRLKTKILIFSYTPGVASLLRNMKIRI